jgi:hypothetical protein
MYPLEFKIQKMNEMEDLQKKLVKAKKDVEEADIGYDLGQMLLHVVAIEKEIMLCDFMLEKCE